MNRRGFLKGAAAAVTGLVFGLLGTGKCGEIAADQGLLLPIEDLVDYEKWATRVYRVTLCPAGEMLGPEWWMTDAELARRAVK